MKKLTVILSFYMTIVVGCLCFRLKITCYIFSHDKNFRLKVNFAGRLIPPPTPCECIYWKIWDTFHHLASFLLCNWCPKAFLSIETMYNTVATPAYFISWAMPEGSQLKSPTLVNLPAELAANKSMGGRLKIFLRAAVLDWFSVLWKMKFHSNTSKYRKVVTVLLLLYMQRAAKPQCNAQ